MKRHGRRGPKPHGRPTRPGGRQRRRVVLARKRELASWRERHREASRAIDRERRSTELVTTAASKESYNRTLQQAGLESWTVATDPDSVDQARILNWDPTVIVEVYPGEWRPPCFGNFGYGTGYMQPGESSFCDTRLGRCDSSYQCWDELRRRVEAEDVEQLAVYNAELTRLRTQPGPDGEPPMNSLEAVLHLRRQGIAPFEKVFVSNIELGQAASRPLTRRRIQNG